MLRECRRVLARGGRIAGYVIHTPDDLHEDRMRRAGELGPADVAADGSPAELAESAGFTLTFHADVTAEFRAVCEAIVRAHADLEGALRSELGHEAYEEERDDKHAMLQGIDEGLLLRSLVLAVNS